MEYLSRILRNIGDLPQFHFHPRCKSVKLTHLCFADDLILCCKGNFNSIYIMLQAFKLFSDASGLMEYINKSSFYCCGMKEAKIQRVIDVSGFLRYTFPFIYLGVLICSKKITTSQCDTLVEKMISRIYHIWPEFNLLMLYC